MDGVRNAPSLGTQLDRWRKFTTRPAAQGHVLGWLSLQVNLLLRSLAYDVTETDPPGDKRFEMSLRRTRGKTSEQILLHGVEGEADFGHVAALGREMERRGIREGWLVSPHRASPAALAETLKKGKPRISCLSLDELIDRHANFDRYFAWVKKEVRDHKIDKNFVELACTKLELDAATNEIRESRYGQIGEYIDRWLDDPSKQHVSVLGEFGTGKTWFSTHYAWTMLDRYLRARAQRRERPRLPLLIRLRNFAEAGSMDELLARFCLEQFQVGISLQALKQLNSMGKLLLILDGFDEMAARCQPEEVVRHFWELAKIVVPESKVILTCRREHFLNAKEGRKLLEGEVQDAIAGLTLEPPRFDIVTLEMLDDRQVRTLLSQRTDPATVKRIMRNPRLVRHARRPVMVEFILDALPRISSRRTVDLSHIYLYAVKKKLAGEVRAGGKSPFQSLADKVFFFGELSWEMLRTGRMTLNYSRFPATLSCAFGRDILARKSDPWKDALRSQNLLTSNNFGDYTPTHRSLIEFFSAYRSVYELGVMADDFLELTRHDEAPADAPVGGARGPGVADEHSPPRPVANPWLLRFCRRDRGGACPRSSGGVRQASAECPASQAVFIYDHLTPNAMSLAVQMVSPRAESIRLLCEIAHHGTGYRASNAQTLLPLFSGRLRKRIAMLLVKQCGAAPAPPGVAWAFGELHVQDEAVRAVLNQTVEAYKEGQRAHPRAWWQASFSLMKLGYLEGETDRNFRQPIERLSAALPADRTTELALKNLETCLTTKDPKEARIDERDIVRIVASSRDARTVRDRVVRLLETFDFSRDELDFRAYFSVWLCSYWRLDQFVPRIVTAAREHAHGAVRTCAAEALGKIGCGSPEVVKTLENLLRWNYYRTRFHAAHSLGDLGAVGSLGAIETAARWEEVPLVKNALELVAGRLRTLISAHSESVTATPLP